MARWYPWRAVKWGRFLAVGWGLWLGAGFGCEVSGRTFENSAVDGGLQQVEPGLNPSGAAAGTSSPDGGGEMPPAVMIPSGVDDGTGGPQGGTSGSVTDGSGGAPGEMATPAAGASAGPGVPAVDESGGLDGGGVPDDAEPDADGDGVPDDEDISPTNAQVCGDSDSDGCDDCTSGRFDPKADGVDFDGDGLCDAGDPDDDGDGIADGADVAPLEPTRCRDLDLDGCDDCTSGITDPANDGPDGDGDGICDEGDSEPVGDPPGFVRRSDSTGCSWVMTDGEGIGTTSAPTDFTGLAAGEPLCVSGTVGGSPEYLGSVLVGINLNQEPDGADCTEPPSNPLPPTVETSGTGVSFDVTRSVTTAPFRIMLLGENWIDDPAHRWCAEVVSTSGQTYVPYVNFNTECWLDEGQFYSGEQLVAVGFLVPGSDTDAEYGFCVNDWADVER